MRAQLMFSRMLREGDELRRRFEQLELERNEVAFFAASWTVVHPITETSPPRNMSLDDLLAADAEFFILLTGTDETFSQIVHARSSYRADEILHGARFVPIFSRPGPDSPLEVDLSKLSETEAASLPV